MPKKGKGKSAKSGKKSSQHPRILVGTPQNVVTHKNAAPQTKQFHGAKGTGLSKCAELYAKALVNPFGEFTELPCVPCTPADMTQKVKMISRGSFSTGTQGIGYVQWAPMNASNDTFSIQYTLPTFTGTTFVTDAVGGVNIVSIAKTQLPYSAARFLTAGNCLQARLVASGIRVTNTTNALNRQGSVLACRLGTGQLLANQTPANLQGNMETVKQTATTNKDWWYWNVVPQDEEDYDFPDGAITYQVDLAGNRGARNYGFMCVGADPSSPSTFDWELIEFWEFAGGNNSVNLPSLSKSHADSVGLSRVLEAIAVPRQSLDLRDMAEHYSLNMIEAMAHSDSAAKTVEDLLGLVGLPANAIRSLTGSLTKMILS